MAHKNSQDGFDWICKAADQNHIGAQYFVASEYSTGDSVNQDLVKEALWYSKAAELGHAEAQYNLRINVVRGERH